MEQNKQPNCPCAPCAGRCCPMMCSDRQIYDALHRAFTRAQNQLQDLCFCDDITANQASSLGAFMKAARFAGIMLAPERRAKWMSNCNGDIAQIFDKA